MKRNQRGWAERCYVLLLRLHPGEFRALFEREMMLDFSDITRRSTHPRRTALSLLADAAWSCIRWRRWVAGPVAGGALLLLCMPAQSERSEDARLFARVSAAAAAVEIGADTALALVWVESRFDSRAVSAGGAMGLTQLMLPTARTLDPSITEAELMDPDLNLQLGLRLLRGLIDQYGELPAALRAYHGGPAAARAVGDVVSDRYVSDVLAALEVYR